MTLPFHLHATKLYFPAARSRLVSRPRLVERVSTGLKGPLTLISAPAGFGKTSLMSEWGMGHGAKARAAWLSLDEEDNEPVRFWMYLIAALEQRQPNAFQSTHNLLKSTHPVPQDVLLASFLSELESLPDDLILILDDWHVITGSSIHQAFASILEHAQPEFHLVLLTRSDPVLPLTRLRAHNQLVELRAEDLRFTSDEAAAFLNTTMGLSLSAEDIAAIENRAEGWAAGLQLVGLSMQGCEDSTSLISMITGSHQYIVDFLIEEVLNRQATHVQSFLLQTSILERMTASLCNALMERTDAQAMLEAAERANLFVTALDTERKWYRYHHLFADVLRRRLQQTSPATVPNLHLRAADWYDQNGFIEETLEHALAAKDFNRAVRLTGQNCRKMVFGGRISTALKWIQSLPESIVRSNPFLCGEYAWILYTQGQLSAAEPLIKDALDGLAHLLASGPLPEDGLNYSSLPALMAALRSLIEARKGNYQAALELAQDAIQCVQPGDELTQALAYIGLAAAYREMGKFEDAIRAYKDVVPVFRTTGNIIASAVVSFHLIQLSKIQGRLSEADAISDEFLSYAEFHEPAQLPAYGMAHIAKAAVLYELNLLDEAAHHLEKGIDQGRLWHHMELLRHGGVIAARIHLARGEPELALNAAKDALQAAQQSQIPTVIAEVGSFQARLEAQIGHLGEASRWVRSTAVKVEAGVGYSQGIQALNYARVLIALDRLEEAQELLSRFEQVAGENGSLGWEIQCLILQAVLLQKQSNLAQALEMLAKSLSLAEPEGYVRTYLDEGPTMAKMLHHVRTLRSHHQYTSRLLSEFSRASGHAIYPSQPLIEPLTERELEVLRLIEVGNSNKEIATKLMITIGTTKIHTVHIFRKLDVTNRTQAVARARELHLV